MLAGKISFQLSGGKVDFYFPHRTSPAAPTPLAPAIPGVSHMIEVFDGNEPSSARSCAPSKSPPMILICLEDTSVCPREMVDTSLPFRILIDLFPPLQPSTS